MQRTMRLKKEMKMIAESPPHGISCWPVDDKLDRHEAKIIGGEETPFSGGVFKLEIQIPERYPFEPPKVRFVTPIYHPNIDTGGRICLDTLKMPPKGAWKPCLNISTVLTSIQLLMAEPNPEDPLMTDIIAKKYPECKGLTHYITGHFECCLLNKHLMEKAEQSVKLNPFPQSNEFKHNRPQFEATARKWTEQHAKTQESLLKPLSGNHSNSENKEDDTEKPLKKLNTGLKRSQPMEDKTNKLQKT